MDLLTELQEIARFLAFFNQHSARGITYEFHVQTSPGERRFLFSTAGGKVLHAGDYTNHDPQIEISKRFFESRWHYPGIAIDGRTEYAGKDRFPGSFEAFAASELRELDQVPANLQLEYRDVFQSYAHVVRAHRPALNELGPSSTTVQQVPAAVPGVPDISSLSWRQIALIEIYQRKRHSDPRSKNNELTAIARLKSSSPTAAQQLYSAINRYATPAKRTGVEKKQKMLSDIRAVLPVLSGDPNAVFLAESDIAVLLEALKKQRF